MLPISSSIMRGGKYSSSRSVILFSMFIRFLRFVALQYPQYVGTAVSEYPSKAYKAHPLLLRNKPARGAHLRTALHNLPHLFGGLYKITPEILLNSGGYFTRFLPQNIFLRSVFGRGRRASLLPFGSRSMPSSRQVPPLRSGLPYLRRCSWRDPSRSCSLLPTRRFR